MEPLKQFTDVIRGWRARNQNTSSPNISFQPHTPEEINPGPAAAELIQQPNTVITESAGYIAAEPTLKPQAEEPDHVEKEVAPVDQYIVAADDTDSEYIAAHVNVLFNEDTDRTHRLDSVTGTMSLLEKAMWGNKNGRNNEQAQVVLLDDNYEPPDYRGRGNPPDPWEHNREEIYQLAEKHGIDFSPFRFNREFQQVNILYYRGSLGKALLLRAFGYSGKIIIVSSSPPRAENLIGHVNSIREVIPNFPAGMPVQGMTLKEPTHYTGQSIMQYSDEVGTNGRWIGKEIENGELADTLRILI